MLLLFAQAEPRTRDAKPDLDNGVEVDKSAKALKEISQQAEQHIVPRRHIWRNSIHEVEISGSILSIFT